MKKDTDDCYEKIAVYEKFLRDLFLSHPNPDNWNYKIHFVQLENNPRMVGTFRQDAMTLLAWMRDYNNDKLPENLEILFNEFILEKCL